MLNRQPSERRDRSDRRVSDYGPPMGFEERRCRPDRRFPAVQFVDFDEHIELGAPSLSVHELH